eukprot:5207866-Pyramimonas_sp.AAC.1
MAGDGMADPGVVHHLLSASWGKFAQITARHISSCTGARKIASVRFGAKLHRAGSMLNTLCLLTARSV